MSDERNNILITGSPGVGKTTIIQRLFDRLSARHAVGFYTREMREHGRRVGFELVSHDNRHTVLSHVDIDSSYRVGKYGVDLSGFERFLDQVALDAGNGPVIIDEIGKMECFSETFLALVRDLLDSQRAVVATIAAKGGGAIAEIKHRPDCSLVTVTRDNRDRLPAKLADMLDFD
ncbi:NTPase [candidate division GN15 bacterium]|nr:NTPase [candidate division GN15 bacterium]